MNAMLQKEMEEWEEMEADWKRESEKRRQDSLDLYQYVRLNSSLSELTVQPRE